MAISKLLLKWYEIEGRELPWRETKDPYKIWISEIILQQTRIQQGMDYYYRFIEKFPDITSLATSDIMEVLYIWQGLGYYSRARNLHHTALTIKNTYNGNFPRTYKEILTLKGIGEYTAGAIASIAFGEVVPAIDGNVKRLVSRLIGSFDDPGRPSGRDKIRTFLTHEIDPDHPGDFNQAMMDLGSMICIPVRPLCNQCPLAFQCQANLNAVVNEIPSKNKMASPKNRFFYYVIITSGEKMIVKQRTGNDIWKLMYDFPMIESSQKLNEKEVHTRIKDLFSESEKKFNAVKESRQIIHTLSHQKIHARFIHIEMQNIPKMSDPGCIAIDKESITYFPLPRLIDRYLQQTNI